MITFDTPVKLTPLYPIARDIGAQFADHDGWNVPEVFTTQEDEVAAAKQGVVLADETPNGKLTVESDEAEAVLQAAFDLPEPGIGEGAAVGSHRIYRLRNDRFLVSTPPGREIATRKTLTDRKPGQFATVTNMTHAWSEIRVIGPASQELMSKVCGLDFDPAKFPDGTARQSSVARTTQLVIRRDIGGLPAFSVLGARSLGAYLWEILMEGGGEWGMAPMGWAAVRALEKS